MDAKITELEEQLQKLQSTFRDITKELDTARQKDRQPKPPGTSDAVIKARIQQLESRHKELESAIIQLQTELSKKRKEATDAAVKRAEAARDDAAAALARRAPSPEPALSSSSESATAPTAVPVPVPAPVAAPVPVPAVVAVPVTAPVAVPVTAATPAPASKFQPEPENIVNNRSNEGIDIYKKEHHDYVEQQIEELEKQIEQLKQQKEETPEKDAEQQSPTGELTWRGGNPPIVNEKIEKLEERVKQLETRVKHLEANCCNEYTKSLIDKNKEKIAQIKHEIQLLKDGMFLYIFGEVYHTSQIYPETTPQPYDGILSLNSFFRNYGLDRRYVAKDIKKDQWSRQYVDNVLEVFFKYFNKDSNPYKVFESQTADQKEEDSVLLCPHLKRRYQTIQWDIARETIQEAALKPKSLEGVGHYYRKIWEELDDFLRKTNICKGKIDLPEKPLKAPSSPVPAVKSAAKPAVNPPPQPKMPTHKIPTPTARKPLPTSKKAAKQPYESPFKKWLEDTARRSALPTEPGKPWQMFPTRQSKPVPTSEPAATQKTPWWKRTPKALKAPKAPAPPKTKKLEPVPLNLHLINYLGNRLTTTPIAYPTLRKITLDKIPQLGQFVLTTPTYSDYVAPNTTALAAYLTNIIGPTDPSKFKQIMGRIKFPSFKRTQSTGYQQLKEPETILNLHLMNYLGNRLAIAPINYNAPRAITLNKIPQLGKFVLITPTYSDYVAPNTTALAAYLTNIIGPTDPSKFKEMMGRIKFPSFKRTQSTGYQQLKEPETILNLHLMNYLGNQLASAPINYNAPRAITLDKIPQLAQFVLTTPIYPEYVAPNTTAVIAYLQNLYETTVKGDPAFDVKGAVLPRTKNKDSTLMPKEGVEAVPGLGSHEPATGPKSGPNELYHYALGKRVADVGNAGSEYNPSGVVSSNQVQLEGTEAPPEGVNAVSGPGSREPTTGPTLESNERYHTASGKRVADVGNAGSEYNPSGVVSPTQVQLEETEAPGDVEAVPGLGSLEPATGPSGFGDASENLLGLTNPLETSAKATLIPSNLASLFSQTPQQKPPTNPFNLYNNNGNKLPQAAAISEQPQGAVLPPTKTTDMTITPPPLQTAEKIYREAVGMQEPKVQMLSDMGEWIPLNLQATPPYFAKGGQVNESLFDKYVNRFNIIIKEIGIQTIETITLPENIFAYELLLEDIDIKSQSYIPHYLIGNIQDILIKQPKNVLFILTAIKTMLMYVYLYNIIDNNNSKEQYNDLLSSYKKSAIRTAQIAMCMYIPATCKTDLDTQIRTELLFRINEMHNLISRTANNNQNNNSNQFAIPGKIARLTFIGNFILKCNQFNTYFKQDIINIEKYIQNDEVALEKLRDINAFIKPRIVNKKFVFNKVKTANLLGLYTPRTASKTEPTSLQDILKELGPLFDKIPEEENDNSSTIASENLENVLGEEEFNLKPGNIGPFVYNSHNRRETNFEQHPNVGPPLNSIKEEENGNLNNNKQNTRPAGPVVNIPQEPPQQPSTNPFNLYNINGKLTAAAPAPVQAAAPAPPSARGGRRRRTLHRN